MCRQTLDVFSVYETVKHGRSNEFLRIIRRNYHQIHVKCKNFFLKISSETDTS